MIIFTAYSVSVKIVLKNPALSQVVVIGGNVIFVSLCIQNSAKFAYIKKKYNFFPSGDKVENTDCKEEI